MSERLSFYFTRAEFACNCGCGADHVSGALVLALTDLRSALGRPVVINSGVRCPEHNRAVGGAEQSTHLTGEAVDIAIASDRERYTVLAVVFRMHLFRRIGIGDGFLHLDVAEGGDHPSRIVWTYSNGR